MHGPYPHFMFDLNNGQMTFKLKKVNCQDHGPADPNMRVI